MGNTSTLQRQSSREGLEAFIRQSSYERDVHFTWDECNRGQYIDVNECNVSTNKSKWGVAISNVIISRKSCDIYKFEIEILDISSSCDSSIMIGFINKSLLNTNVMEYNSNLNVYNKKQFAIRISNNNEYISLHGQHKTKDELPQSFDIKNGDRFELAIDFKRKQIKLYHNDVFVDTIFERLSLKKHTEFVPCVALFNSTIQVTKSSSI